MRLAARSLSKHESGWQGGKRMRACMFMGRRQGWSGVYTPWAYVPRMVCGCRCLINAYLHKENEGFNANTAGRPMHMCFAAHRGHAFALLQGAHREGQKTFCVRRRTLVLAERIVEGYEEARGVPSCLSAVFAFRCTLGRVIGLWHTGAQEISSSARGGQRKLVGAPPSCNLSVYV